MRKTGEWAEFFSMTLSPYAYNHAIANRYFPKTKDEVLSQGLIWYDRETEDVAKALDANALPAGVPSNNEPLVVKSIQSSRPFRITTKAIDRYRSMNVPLPRKTYDERMEGRAKLVGGVVFFDRTCAKTGKPIKTTYPPESPWIVWDRDEWEKEYRG